jgi:MFS family permease
MSDGRIIVIPKKPIGPIKLPRLPLRDKVAFEKYGDKNYVKSFKRSLSFSNKIIKYDVFLTSYSVYSTKTLLYQGITKETKFESTPNKSLKYLNIIFFALFIFLSSYKDNHEELSDNKVSFVILIIIICIIISHMGWFSIFIIWLLIALGFLCWSNRQEGRINYKEFMEVLFFSAIIGLLGISIQSIGSCLIRCECKFQFLTLLYSVVLLIIFHYIGYFIRKNKYSIKRFFSKKSV